MYVPIISIIILLSMYFAVMARSKYCQQKVTRSTELKRAFYFKSQMPICASDTIGSKILA